MNNQLVINASAFVKRNSKNFTGVSVETQDHLERLIGEGTTGHWVASVNRLRLQSQIIIVSKHEPGKIVVADVTSVEASNSFPGRWVMRISNAVIKVWKIGKNEKLQFSRNPVHYY
jgi:hypothetical protein